MSKDIKAFCQPDSKGFFGAYGGQYVPDAIKARLDELDQAFKEALADPEFTREMQRLLLHFAGRPQSGLPLPQPQQEAGRRADLAQARRPQPSGRPQGQQYHRPVPAGQTHG